MMKLGAVVLVWLSTDGYWFGGSTATVGMQWAVGDAMPPAALAWRLHAADITLAEGQQPLPADGSAGHAEIALPRVRVPIAAQLVWRVDRVAKKEASPRPGSHVPQALAEGSLTAHLYPKSLLQGTASLLAGKQVIVWDNRDGLPAILEKAKLNVRVVSDESELAFARPDLLIVAANRLNGRSAAQGQQRLMNLAANGSNVLVLAQSGGVVANGIESSTHQMLGYSLTMRQLPRKLEWREDHPLACSLQLSEKPELPAFAWAIRIPAADPALEIAWWPPEVLGRDLATTDALVVTKAVQKGRITMCQVSLGPWQSDPRSQLFLVDAIDYLVSPVVPTPPISKRLALQLQR